MLERSSNLDEASITFLRTIPPLVCYFTHFFLFVFFVPFPCSSCDIQLTTTYIRYGNINKIPLKIHEKSHSLNESIEIPSFEDAVAYLRKMGRIYGLVLKEKSECIKMNEKKARDLLGELCWEVIKRAIELVKSECKNKKASILNEVADLESIGLI
jgi:hypothetical protein